MPSFVGEYTSTVTSPRIIDRALLPLRLARARARARFLDERSVSAFTVESFDLGFPEGEAAYNGMGVSSDGSVWFSVGTRDAACGARIFVLDPRTSAIDCASDLTHTLGSGSRA